MNEGADERPDDCAADHAVDHTVDHAADHCGDARVTRLRLHAIAIGDRLRMIGPDGARSEPFVLGDLPALRCENVWIYRAGDAPIVVPRAYGLDARFELHAPAEH